MSCDECTAKGGASGVVLGGGIIGGDWRNAPIEKVAESNPQVALARVMSVPLQPWIANIRGTFQDGTTPIGPFSWMIQGSTGTPDQQRANTFAIVDRIVFQIDAPNSNEGAPYKPQTDFFFGLQSGLESTLVVDGNPKYIVSPDFTPIRSLVALLNEGWPMGWVLTNTNIPKMQFNISDQNLIQSFPTKVTVTYRMWIPNQGDARGRAFTMMTDLEAYRQLKKRGVAVSDHCLESFGT